MESIKSQGSKTLTKSLPAEVWDKIFSYLPHEDLLKSTLVSKSFNKLISNSTTFIRKTGLKLYKLIDHNIRPDFDHFFIHEFRIKRKYRWLSFSLSRMVGADLYHHLLTQLIPTASDLHNVTFNGCEFSIDDFTYFIQRCKLLRELEISSCRFKKTSEVIPSIELSLECFRFYQSDEWILDHFNCRRVKRDLEFERAISDRYGLNGNTDEIVRFLNKIEGDVGKLKLREVDVDKTSVELDPKFKWMELDLFAETINTMFNDTMPNKEKLYAAASPNATTLTFRFDRGHQRLYDVIASTKSVNKLFIGDGMFTKTHLPYDDLETLDHIKELIFTSGIEAPQDQESSSNFQTFMNKFTGLKLLRMNSIVARNLNISDEVQPYQRNLKSIELYLPDGILNQMTIEATTENLKKLILPEMERLVIMGNKRHLLHVRFAELMSAISENSPRLQKMLIKLDLPLPTEDELYRIMLIVYAAMRNVSVFEIEWDYPQRLFRRTRAEIIMQFFGNDEAICRTFALMQGREFRR